METVEIVEVALESLVGTFFLISGVHKLFVRERHAALRHTLEEDHIPLVRFNEWWVPAWEVIAGLGLIVAGGTAADFFAMILVIICLVATCTDGLKRIKEWHPLNAADYLDDILYLPEVLLLVILLTTIIL